VRTIGRRCLHDIRKLPCAFERIECKNHTIEVANPKIDQLAGRFSVNRGMFGFLCCRTFENRNLFIERCRDTHRDGRGLIVPLDDAKVLKILTLVQSNRRQDIDAEVTKLASEVWVS
jgi:hypothetical protein